MRGTQQKQYRTNKRRPLSNADGKQNTMKVYHASLETAQHGPKGLLGCLQFTKKAKGSGIIASNFLLQGADGKLRSASEIKAMFDGEGMLLDGVSCHCPLWVHTTAWTGSPSIRPFIPGDVAKLSVEEIEAWAENYLLELFDLCAELGVKILTTFWGNAWGWEVASGYPWGFWTGPDFELIKRGNERFVTKTAKIRARANELGIKLCHEIHPGTGAQCADDMLKLLSLTDNDPCMAVNGDPSHCWEGEDMETRFRKVGHLIWCTHVKNHHVVRGMALRCMAEAWPERPMQFVPLADGDLNMLRYVELLVSVGYPQRYRGLMGTATAPLAAETESGHWALDTVGADGIAFINDKLCLDVAEGSFQDGMGEAK